MGWADRSGRFSGEKPCDLCANSRCESIKCDAKSFFLA